MLVAFAASAVGTGRVAAQQTAPGAAACTALGAGMFTAVATLTATYDAGTAAQPAHCVVRGSAAPRTGIDGKAYETASNFVCRPIGAAVPLPGGGGNDGIVAPAVGRNTGSFPDTGLQRGFAVVTTDAGHQGGTPGSVSILSCASIMLTPRTNEPRQSHLRSCRAITAAPRSK